MNNDIDFKKYERIFLRLNEAEQRTYIKFLINKYTNLNPESKKTLEKFERGKHIRLNCGSDYLVINYYSTHGNSIFHFDLLTSDLPELDTLSRKNKVRILLA